MSVLNNLWKHVRSIEFSSFSKKLKRFLDDVGYTGMRKV